MSAAQIMGLVASGRASSRADLARLLGLAPSTVSAHVQDLLDAGLLVESGEGRSRGGRKPRLLRLPGDGGVLLAADLGAHHARLAALDSSGRPLLVRPVPIDLTIGPDALLTRITGALADVHAELGGDRPMLAIGVGLPGPVNRAGVVTGPSRMPGWNGFAVRAWLAERYDVPIVVDNDANLMALGEAQARGGEPRDFVYVKAGTGIGAAVVGDGRLHRGAQGIAGDISHIRVEAGDERPCSCGNHGCLETIASGAALVAAVRDELPEVTTPTELVAAADDGSPAASARLRYGGRQLGEVLATVVNFFNPQAVIVGGALARSDPFLAAARSVLYQRCLPLATQNLEIGVSVAGVDAGLLGIAHAALEARLPHEQGSRP